MVISPSATAASRPAPRAFAFTGSVTCSMVRPSTSAKIWHHTSERAPPPMNRIGSSRRRVKRSTAPSSQRVLSATPSKTARTRSSRLADSDRLWNPPRTEPVFHRGPLAVKPRGEDHPAAPGRGPPRHRVEFAVGEGRGCRRTSPGRAGTPGQRRLSPARRRRSTAAVSARAARPCCAAGLVFLNGTWQVSQDEVPTYRCAW